MIIGVGIDVTELGRLTKSLALERFEEYVFSERERAAFSGRRDRVSKYAGCFAAKEAFGKALGTGVDGFALCEVSVLRDERGKPYLELEGRAADIVRSLGARAFVSITNTDEYAAAAVILEADG